MMPVKPAVVAAVLLVLGSPARAASASDVARGSYLVNGSGCADCHMPMKMTPSGPASDASRGLSGHPQDLVLPAPPASQGPWIAGSSATNTAFYGPWGVSYAANLTADPVTGLGAWTAAQFVATMRTGRHLGVGRPILPPMPWRAMGHLTDDDLRAVFAYLQPQPAVTNRVPSRSSPRRAERGARCGRSAIIAGLPQSASNARVACC